MTRAVQACTTPEALAGLLVSIAGGNGARLIEGSTGTVVPIQVPTVKDQLKALGMLMAWGWVKPPTQSRLAIDDGRGPLASGFDESRLSDAEIATLGALLGRAALPGKGETGG